MARYLQWLAVHNYSGSTIEHRDQVLELFAAWSEARNITEPREVTRPILERYQRQLFHQRKKNGRPLSFAVQAGRLGIVRKYFGWLARQSVLLANPASDLEMPRIEKRLPRHVLTAEEAERVLAIPRCLAPRARRPSGRGSGVSRTARHNQKVMLPPAGRLRSARGAERCDTSPVNGSHRVAGDELVEANAASDACAGDTVLGDDAERGCVAGVEAPRPPPR